MVVVFDTNYLILLLQARSDSVIRNPDTGEAVELVKEKIEHLLRTLNKSKVKILIPTPVLAETFTMFGDRANEIVATLNQTYGFEFADFNTAAAIEAGLALHPLKGQGKNKDSRTAWQKVKFDRQIVSIARVNNVSTVYSCDKQVISWSRKLGMRAIPVWELDSPPPSQVPMEYSEPEEDSEHQNDVEQGDAES